MKNREEEGRNHEHLMFNLWVDSTRVEKLVSIIEANKDKNAVDMEDEEVGHEQGHEHSWRSNEDNNSFQRGLESKP